MGKVIGIDFGTTRGVVSVIENGAPTVIKAHFGANENFSDDDKDLTLQEISARILQRLKLDAETYLGEKVSQAVIAVPALFTNAQRQAVKEIAAITGLEVLRIISKTSAAALAYEFGRNSEETILFCNFGEKNFEVSIAELDQHVVEVKAVSGTTQLDDGDFDKKISSGIRNAMNDAGLTDVDKIISVGGASKIPALRNVVREILGKEISTILGDEYVAVGAAIQGGVLSGEFGKDNQTLLLDVTPLSLGLEVSGGKFAKLIKLNTPLPVSDTEVFSTTADNQTEIEFHLLQGESEQAAENSSVGRFVISDLPPTAKGVPQIEVTFVIDSSGLVSVNARDKLTGLERKIKIESPNLISREELERITQAAAAYEEKFKRRPEPEAPAQDDRLLRLQADFNNFRRRTAREKDELKAAVEQEFLKDLLPLLDNLSRAAESADNADAETLRKGVEMIKQEFVAVMSRHGLDPIETLNQPFDPNFHQAVGTVKDKDKADGFIANEFQRGYVARGKVIRPSMVQVVNNS